MLGWPRASLLAERLESPGVRKNADLHDESFVRTVLVPPPSEKNYAMLASYAPNFNVASCCPPRDPPKMAACYTLLHILNTWPWVQWKRIYQTLAEGAAR